MALAVGKECVAGGKQRAVQADRGQRILQGAARAKMHVDVAGGHRRQAARGGQCKQHGESRRVIGARVQFDGQPGTGRKVRCQPAAFVRAGVGARYPQCQAVRDGTAAAGDLAGYLQITTEQTVFTLARASACQRDQRREVAVTGAVLRQQDQPEA